MATSRSVIEYYTHNNFKVYDDCKRRYYYEYIRKLHWPALNSNFDLGLSVHKLLDYQAKGLETSIFIDDAKDDVKELWNFVKTSEIAKKPIMASEWAFNVRILDTDFWLQGRVDRIIKQADPEKYVIVDFKTGQLLPSPNKTDWQSIIYLYSIAITKNIKPENLEFLYYKVEAQPEIRQIFYSESLHKDFENLIVNKIKTIESTTSWPANDNCTNKYCQYSRLCKTSLLDSI